MVEAHSTARLMPPPAADAPAERPIDTVERIGRIMHGRLWIGKTANTMALPHHTLRRWLAGLASPAEDDIEILKQEVRDHAAGVIRAIENETSTMNSHDMLPPAVGGNGGPAIDERPYAILERIGRAMHGPHWHGKIAADIGENERALRRWRAGDGEPSPRTIAWARDEARRYIARLQRAIEE
jgi:hypothetical protein